MTRPVSPRSWYADPDTRLSRMSEDELAAAITRLRGVPSPESIRKADKAQALVASGLCPGCGQSKDVERESVWCAKCDGKED